MSTRTHPKTRADALRADFDATFAFATGRNDAPTEDLLAIRVAGDAYALRLTECGGLFADRKVTPLPTAVTELVGLVGFRATLVPVYDLRALLGYPSGETSRWMVSTAGVALVALAFDTFEAHLRVESATLVIDDARAQAHAPTVAHLPGGSRPVLSVPSLLEAIEARARSNPPKEL
jgi:purine-binding chemotaxis protein CheW